MNAMLIKLVGLSIAFGFWSVLLKYLLAGFVAQICVVPFTMIFGVCCIGFQYHLKIYRFFQGEFVFFIILNLNIIQYPKGSEWQRELLEATFWYSLTLGKATIFLDIYNKIKA